MTLPLLLVAAAAPVARAAPEVGFTLREELAVDPVGDRPGEDRVESFLRASARASGDAGADGRWFLAVRGRHALRWTAWGEAPGESALEGEWEVAVGESGWEGALWQGESLSLRLRAGHLVERWGRMDLLPVVDVLNPRDLRDGALTPVDERVLPMPMARLQLGGLHARAELTVLPFAGRDRVGLVGTDRSVFRQGMLADLAAEAQGWEGDALTETQAQEAAAALETALRNMDPSLRQGADLGLQGSGAPQALPGGVEAGLRLEAEGGPADGALVVATVHARRPAMSADPALVALLQEERLPGLADTETLLSSLEEPVVMDWPRAVFAGADGSVQLGPVGLRAEGGWTSARPVQRTWLQSAVRPVVGAAAGVDWLPRPSVLLAVEGRWEHVLDAPADMMLAAPHQVQLGGAAQVSVLRDRVALQLGGLYDATFTEGMLRPRVRWSARDDLALELGCVVLVSQTPPPADLRAALVHAGGPLGYAADDDAVTAAITWIR